MSLEKSYLLTDVHTHPHAHTTAVPIDWQRPTDTPTDWKKDERKESDRGKGKDRERRSDPQPDTNWSRQRRDKQKERQTDGPSDNHWLCLSVRVLGCSVKRVVTNWFGLSNDLKHLDGNCSVSFAYSVPQQQWFMWKPISRELPHLLLYNFQCWVMPFSGKSSGAQEMNNFLFICFWICGRTQEAATPVSWAKVEML